MSESQERGAGRVVLLLSGLVIVGIPLVAYLWETLNQVLAGHLSARRVLLSLPLLAAFAGLLWAGGRGLERLAAPPPDRPGDPNLAGTLFLVALLLMLIFGGWLTGYALLLRR
ncbi:MAG TPA: hypothetical protein VNI61_08505 [Gemmatimonadales bacterium]|nr:hypothetical protein [Gemmatimonadales bacterium]